MFCAWLLKIAKEHDCTTVVFLVSNSVKLTHKSKKSCNFRVFGLKKYENRKLCVSYVALHKKHVCNLCTHEKNMCVTCVRYLKIEVENTTCVYVLYVWCAVLDSTLILNFIVLLRVVHILAKKLKEASLSREERQQTKVVKAGLTLVQSVHRLL